MSQLAKKNIFLQNIPKVFALNFFMMFLVVIPIIVPYWESFQLKMEDVYKLQAIFAMTVIVLDIPMGYLSDILSRKTCLIAMGIFNALSYQFLLHGDTFYHFALFEFCAAISVSLFSGTDIALIYDSLDAAKIEEDNHMSFLGKRIYFSQIGETFGSLLGGYLAATSLKNPVWVNSFTAIIPFFIALTVHEPPRVKLNHRNHFENIKFMMKSLFGHSTLLTTMIIFNIAYGFSTFAAVWAFQSYWKAADVPLQYYGYLWASFNLVVAILARNAGRIEKKCSSIGVVLMAGISPILGYFLMAYFKYHWAYVFAIFFALTRSLNSVVVQDGINARVPNSMRATTNSFCSLGMRSVFVVLGPWIGRSIDQHGVHQTFYKLSGVYVLFFILILIPLALQRKQFRPLKTN